MTASSICRLAAGLVMVAMTTFAMSPAASAPAGAPPAAPAASAQPEYKVGDKLKTHAPGTAAAHQIEWEDLMPKGWDPAAGVASLPFSAMMDGDPRAIEALRKLKKAWDEAPVEPSMDKRHVVIAGFALPLDAEGEQVHELLLVPYFGACIHTPPPPANQVIHVVLSTPAKRLRMMDTVWITGVLHVESRATDLAASAYRLDGEKLAPYRGGTHP